MARTWASFHTWREATSLSIAEEQAGESWDWPVGLSRPEACGLDSQTEENSGVLEWGSVGGAGECIWQDEGASGKR